MSLTLKSIEQKRRELIRVHAENKFNVDELYEGTYPDKAHFVYELLQNAEDESASVATFKLAKDALTFSHNGKVFDIGDVEAITTQSNSTKKNDSQKIGRHGAGFKSVFVYSDRPHIRSGKFDFAIEDLFVPVGREDRDLFKGTEFYFPLGTGKKKRSDAVKDINVGLGELNETSLLFLRNLQKIEYEYEDGTRGFIHKRKISENIFEIKRSKGENQRSIVTRWWVGVSPIKSTPHNVAIAFALSSKTNKKPSHLIPVKTGSICTFFPCARETSNLLFHIHAPFDTPTDRASIQDSELNENYLGEIAKLASQSIIDLAQQELLNSRALEVLPNSNDHVPERYESIVEEIHSVFKNSPVTPKKTGGFERSLQLCCDTGPLQVKGLITDEDLKVLTRNSVVDWVDDNVKDTDRYEQFLSDIEVQELDNDTFLEQFEDMTPREIDVFVSKRSDRQLFELYALMGEIGGPYGYYPFFKILKIVRATSSEGDIHCVPSEIFFREDSDKLVQEKSDPFWVKKSVYLPKEKVPKEKKQYAKQFLESIGVRIFNDLAIAEQALAEYESFSQARSKQQFEVLQRRHISDIRGFLKIFEDSERNYNLDRRRFIEKLRTIELFIFDSEREDNSDYFVSGKDLFVDAPWRETGMAKFTNAHNLKKLASLYFNEFGPQVDRERFIKFIEHCGARSFPEIVEREIHWPSDAYQELCTGWRGARYTNQATNEDFTIENIDMYFNSTLEGSFVVWSAIQSQPKNLRYQTARFRPNGQHSVREGRSTLLRRLEQAKWLPDKHGAFHRPNDIAEHNLHPKFKIERDTDLLRALQIGKNDQRQAEMAGMEQQLIKSGLSPENAKKLMDLLKSEPELVEQVVSSKSRPGFPSRNPPNPERRNEKIRKRYEETTYKRSERRSRAIDPDFQKVKGDSRQYLRDTYTNDDGQMVCQGCQLEMPFKINGVYHFEAVKIVNLPKDDDANYFALCPICAAKYRYGRDESDGEIKQLILNVSPDEAQGSTEIEISMIGHTHRVRFQNVHLSDIKSILQDS